MSRREVRDSAFKLVFEQLLRNDPVEELYEIAEEIEMFIYAEKEYAIRICTIVAIGGLILTSTFI